jgi:hypothetical protein
VPPIQELRSIDDSNGHLDLPAQVRSEMVLSRTAMADALRAGSDRVESVSVSTTRTVRETCATRGSAGPSVDEMSPGGNPPGPDRAGSFRCFREV